MPAKDQTSSLLARQHIQYEDPFARFTQYANQQGQQIRADERYADDKLRKELERSQDVAFREAEAKRAGEQFNKDYTLREAVAGREAEKFGREKLGDTRLQGMQSDISAGLQHGLLTQVQQKNIENKLGTFSDADIASGRAADVMTKQFQNILKAPETTQQKLDLIRGYQTTGDGYDASKLLSYQQQLAKPYEDQLAKDAEQAFRLKLSDREQAAANARLGKQLSADKTAREHSKAYPMYNPRTGETTVAYGPSELSALEKTQQWLRGEAPAKTKSTPFASVLTSPILKGVDIGSSDTQKLLNVASALQRNYKLTPDEAGSIAYSGIQRGLIEDSVNPKKMQAILTEALAPQRFGKQYSALTQKQKDELYKETADIINPAME